MLEPYESKGSRTVLRGGSGSNPASLPDKFIRADPDLQELFDVKDYKSSIVARETLCEILALSKDEGVEDGHRAIFCSVDSWACRL